MLLTTSQKVFRGHSVALNISRRSNAASVGVLKGGNPGQLQATAAEIALAQERIKQRKKILEQKSQFQSAMAWYHVHPQGRFRQVRGLCMRSENSLVCTRLSSF